ncbi:hypothetical protein B0H13DRAFT_1869513 [Mycena leptocephala]|nr:hypothetical protein B0H13DRAFT_1869513 [Mycena leptocephala]
MPTKFGSLMRSTLEAIYSLGFTETFLEFGSGGAACYARYLSMILALLSRPHAVAFIAAGGILSFLAQLYDKELVLRFLEGPSLQVTEYAKGKTCWINNGLEDEVWTSDQISEGEISILLGHVVTGNPSTDTFLWPHPSWLEQESDHFHGAWTAGAYSFLKTWSGPSSLTSTMSGARARSGRDFETGMDLIESAFPLNWEKRALTDISIPEADVRLFSNFSPNSKTWTTSLSLSGTNVEPTRETSDKSENVSLLGVPRSDRTV